ncbi:MAG: NAD(P)/FAD-dependent oxidoreductase [Pseudomonadota bacterium]|nr:NAD(P)/FAD-dependent oxidoreductase [Pseudomonadota bacterium]
MDRPIHRRDFLNGAAIAVGALGGGLLGGSAARATGVWPQDQPAYYPPSLTGMRGSHVGSFENAHALRDGDFWTTHTGIQDTGETYDLVIVGGGISGLSAAHFYRAANPGARILILENHDDFGGHAKRNEFHLDGKLHLLNGGTLEIDSPRPYSAVAGGLLTTLGIDPVALSKACDRDEVYSSLGLRHGVFFDKETFGVDRLVAGAPAPWYGQGGSWPTFLAASPLSEPVRADILRIETGAIDYMPGLTSAEKKDRLSRISYRDYLLTIAKADPGVVPFYQSHTQGEWGVGIDAVSALDCWGFYMPGFKGLKLDPGPAPRMSYTPAGYVQGGSYVFHFPDGNASIARLLVRDLVPGAVPGRDCRDVVTAKVDYARLDRPENPVRIRLSSICVRARNLGDPATSLGVELAYARGQGVFRVRGKACVLASWNMMIPYICPEMPSAQKAALHKLVKTPLVYTSVALRNWSAFQKLGVASMTAPGSYHTSLRLNWPVDIGDYTAERSPQAPILVHMTRTPCQPGLSEFDQNQAGRYELLATPFEEFERRIRDQLGRSLAGGGFDPARDITAITVNRWPHGYAPEWNALWDPPLPQDQLPNVIGRARFGAIAIANSDAGAAAYTDCAIDQAHRAVGDLLTA